MKINLDIERTTSKRRAEAEMWNEALAAWAKAHAPGADSTQQPLAWLGGVLKCISIVTGRPVTEVHAEWAARQPNPVGSVPERRDVGTPGFAEAIEEAVTRQPGGTVAAGSFARKGADGVTRVGQARVAPTSIMGEPVDGEPIQAPTE